MQLTVVQIKITKVKMVLNIILYFKKEHNLISKQPQKSQWDQDVVVQRALIKYTDDRELFLTERWSRENFGYIIPIKEEGQYKQFNKHAFNQPDKRVWDIYIGKKLVKKNFDPYQAAGDIHSASNVYMPFIFKNKKIFFDDEECVSAYNDKRQAFLLYFKHIGKDNPMVNGIILFKGKLEETDFFKQDSMKKMYEYQYDKKKRQNIYEQKYLKTRSLAKMKHKKRNDNILIVEEFDQVFIEEELSNKINYYFIIGTFITSFLVGMFVVDVIKGVNEASMDDNKKKLSQLNFNLTMKAIKFFYVQIQVSQ